MPNPTDPTTIPAAVVLQLRGALYHQLGSTAEDLASVDYSPPADRLSEWSEPIARFDRARALLDRIGWCAPDPERDVEIDLDRHRRVIADALGQDLLICRSLASEKGEAEDQRERARAQVVLIEAFAENTGIDLVHEPERWVTVPDDLLTQCLLGTMREMAESVERCGFNGECYDEPLERFDTIRAAIDAIEWGARSDIDVSAHQWALQLALTDRLGSERHMIEEGVRAIAQGIEAGKRQHEHATSYALQIERFMEDAGLDILSAGNDA
jgi:hypothetical protein